MIQHLLIQGVEEYQMCRNEMWWILPLHRTGSRITLRRKPNACSMIPSIGEGSSVFIGDWHQERKYTGIKKNYLEPANVAAVCLFWVVLRALLALKRVFIWIGVVCGMVRTGDSPLVGENVNFFFWIFYQPTNRKLTTAANFQSEPNANASFYIWFTQKWFNMVTWWKYIILNIFWKNNVGIAWSVWRLESFKLRRRIHLYFEINWIENYNGPEL